jgi:hypothetical protein
MLPWPVAWRSTVRIVVPRPEVRTVPVPFPSPDLELRTPPDEHEVVLLARGVSTAIAPATGLTPLQVALVTATIEAMTDHAVDPRGLEPLDPAGLAAGLAPRSRAFRSRIVQLMVLGELILAPLPLDVSDRVAAYAAELGVDDQMIRVAHRFAEGSLGLAMVDFSRNGYVPDLELRVEALGLTAEEAADEADDAWGAVVADTRLAARWEALGDLPDGSLGAAVFRFYRARGFVFPGLPGSAPPLLAQHDWVHVLADYGTTLESELEVFALIARANDDPRAFSLLAMVISLFETGYLASGAGLFQASRGHLSNEGVAVRLADAMRRGALCHDGLTGDDSVDFLAVNWFELAPLPMAEVRELFHLTPRSDRARVAGSMGPWEAGGISPFQLAAGRSAAEREGRGYDSYGAMPR